MRPMPSAKRAGKQHIAVVTPGPFPMCQQISERMEILKDVPLFSIPTERTGKFLNHLLKPCTLWSVFACFDGKNRTIGSVPIRPVFSCK